jgi:hypothetical protein
VTEYDDKVALYKAALALWSATPVGPAPVEPVEPNHYQAAVAGAKKLKRRTRWQPTRTASSTSTQ